MAAGGEEQKTIQFDSTAVSQINNQYGTYKGTLIQHLKDNGEPGKKVYRTPNVTPRNKDETIVQMYSYKSIPPTDGTYVVLQFKESEMYAASKEGRPDVLVLEEPGEFDTEDAEAITTTADRRLFLMKPVLGAVPAADFAVTDFVFASCIASQQNPGDKNKARVITLLKSQRFPARLKREGRAPLESQYFQPVPLEGVSKLSDKHPVQEQEVQLGDRMSSLS
ncbi:uncharacterized protein LOC118406836 [Branchiostoma floridae]|uniref:Uncharacterized protein LOC118406836 n=1 Tax=Branchiostoma floridae TaxID=7739 RepID=A0A9J7KKA3_BRAFL|nr:uncharacterized protein LOC118406836 [Branchiostoma floridae]